MSEAIQSECGGGPSRILIYGRGFFLLLLFLVAGQLIERALSLPVPGNVLGMILMALALLCGLVRLESVKPCADLLLRHLGFFFVPAGVGLIQHLHIIAAEWVPILVGTLLSTVAVLWLGGGTTALLMRRKGRE
ncbi:MAG: CidA/LrgA family protein [Lentisphaerae bacterium]|nr:CidA/LrgA family protein [Lentisphaerota bacterium]